MFVFDTVTPPPWFPIITRVFECFSACFRLKMQKYFGALTGASGATICGLSASLGGANFCRDKRLSGRGKACHAYRLVVILLWSHHTRKDGDVAPHPGKHASLKSFKHAGSKSERRGLRLQTATVTFPRGAITLEAASTQPRGYDVSLFHSFRRLLLLPRRTMGQFFAVYLLLFARRYSPLIAAFVAATWRISDPCTPEYLCKPAAPLVYHRARVVARSPTIFTVFPRTPPPKTKGPHRAEMPTICARSQRARPPHTEVDRKFNGSGGAPSRPPCAVATCSPAFGRTFWTKSSPCRSSPRSCS